MQRVTSKLQFEHEQKLADLRLLEKQKIAELEREREKEADQRKKEADEREERARKGRLELLAAEQETHKMEQETARLQIQVMEERRKSSPPGTPLPPRHEKNWERMCPIYNDTEDIEEFLSTFEHLCNLYQIPEGQRMPVLLTRLTGKAREVFNDLGEQEALDYERFKDSVLRRFKVTPESYRVKFREFKISKDCTFVECAYKLMGFVKKWVMGAKAHGSFEKLLDIITLEQFLDIVPDHVRAAVCDRDPESVLRAAEIADAHTQNRAREGYKTPGKTNHHSPQFKRREGFKNKPDSSKGVQGGLEGRNSHPRTEQVTCYHCGMLGPMRPDCPTLKGSPKPATPNAMANANPVVVNSQASHTEPSIGALCANAVSVVSEEFDLKTHIRAKYGGNNAEFISSAEVNGVRCMAWRDTAADITLVKASLVRKEDYLPGEDVTVVALSKYFVRVPLAKIHLKWKGLEGTMVVGVKDIIPKDIMIGKLIQTRHKRGLILRLCLWRVSPKVCLWKVAVWL
uniref:SCAN box domain-containing protein n=1 Tax=Chrysemys picta bellii TaxID=8478 RepID=A0A8C3I3U1_CHRPI